MKIEFIIYGTIAVLTILGILIAIRDIRKHPVCNQCKTNNHTTRTRGIAICKVHGKIALT